ncbi:HIT family protein [Piscinibacter sakaiensis]|uniref:HIT family protein n=1 Tax=Piscinibacter sakaiensis TaxID=1547922 RepID=UPI003AAD5A21
MNHSNCLFCRIGSGEVPARIVAETDDVVAFLDIRPIREGHVLVMPKPHHAYFDDMPPALTQQVMGVAQRLAPVLRSEFGVERVGLLFSGVDIAHAHAHLVPMVEPTDLTSPRYFEEKQLTFRPAPLADGGQLDATAERIRNGLARHADSGA